jgi:hypothetical protein
MQQNFTEPSSFKLLAGNVSNYLNSTPKAEFGAFVCSPSRTVQQILETMVEEKIHR